MTDSSFLPVSVTWNGTAVSGPVLIYHDEVAIVPAQNFLPLFDHPGGGILACRGNATSQGVAWHYAHGDMVTTSPLLVPFYQSIAEAGSVSRLARGHNIASPFSGLWTCRQNGNADTAIPVGLYQRGGGK